MIRLEITSFGLAGVVRASFFRRFFYQERSTAFWTGMGNRFVPGGIITLGKSTASEEDLTASGLLLNEISVASLRRAAHTGILP